jgi:hypothetical protein
MYGGACADGKKQQQSCIKKPGAHAEPGLKYFLFS